MCRTADPRYVGRGDKRSGGDIVFDLNQIRNYVNNLDTIENEASNWAWLNLQRNGICSRKRSIGVRACERQTRGQTNGT